jgi:serine/threonine protein kinase/Tfp pilus assembly protein PilF
MSPERWRQIERLYHAILEQDPSVGALLLERADPELRREVESLLNQPSRNVALERPAWEISAGTLSPGSLVGPYRIEAEIGAGGMGQVWRARDTRLDRDVAIKTSREQFNDRFQREARAIAALNHPHICHLFDVGPDYLVMEYIEGTPLKGPLPVEKAVEYGGQILDALDEAHRQGIVHRDLKPTNILVTKRGVKLLDFGLAKQTAVPGDASVTRTALTRAGQILGTLQYMAPEQLQGKEADARSDLFSFGCVLYEMLSGKRAFEKESGASVIAAILEREPAPLQLSDGQAAPSKLSQVVTRCLRKSPASRFQTTTEVRTALEQALPGQTAAAPASSPPSIAVLPFVNMSADKENEYFSDGLAEEILNLLAKIPGLKVIARTSSFAFRGKEQDITKIAEALRVRTILEGSVRRAGSRIRVTAQLIEAENGSHLWSERYDRDMTDVFAIQDEIGQAISQALRVQLAPRAQAVNIEAWQNYLKGQYHLVRLTPESLAKAKGCFEQALAIDPNYAPAYTGLAKHYHALGLIGMKPVGDMAPLVKSAAQKALAIDPADSEATSLFAVMAATDDHDWKTAETHFRRALAAEPVPPMVRFEYVGFYLLPLGRFADAMEQSRLALEIDPLSTILHNGMALSMLFARQYQETIAYARRALEIDANFYPIWITMGLAQLAAGFAQEAITSIQRLVELTPWISSSAWLLAAACHQAGDRERSQELARKSSSSPGSTGGTGLYYATVGEVDAMFEALDESYRQRIPMLASHIQHLPFFDPYRADPRFQSLLQRMNLA